MLPVTPVRSHPAQGSIPIGASLSLTGTYAKPGKCQEEGYKLCEKELNAVMGPYSSPITEAASYQKEFGREPA